jgi:hypothetical protein
VTQLKGSPLQDAGFAASCNMQQQCKVLQTLWNFVKYTWRSKMCALRLQQLLHAHWLLPACLLVCDLLSMQAH